MEPNDFIVHPLQHYFREIHTPTLLSIFAILGGNYMDLEDFKKFLNDLWRVIRYWVWDIWHGESVAETQTRRIMNPYAPAFHLRGFAVPVWLVLLVVFIAIIAATVSLSNIGWISSEKMLINVQATKLTPVTACSAVSSSGRLYIALDCLIRSPTTRGIFALLMYAVFQWFVYYTGFLHGKIYATSKKEAEL